jgi:hypothetical protein
MALHSKTFWSASLADLLRELQSTPNGLTGEQVLGRKRSSGIKKKKSSF